MDDATSMSESVREIYELRRAKGLEPHDPRELLGVAPGVEAPLSVADWIATEVRARSGVFDVENFMGEVDGEEI